MKTIIPGITGIYLFSWNCPACGHTNCEASDALTIHCDNCRHETTFADPQVIVTRQQPLESFVPREG